MQNRSYKNRPLVLVVDDELGIRESLFEALKTEFSVSMAQNLEAAENFLKRKKFAVALLDIALPDGNGSELLLIMKKVSPFTEVIMLTANNSISEALTCMARGAYDYVTKPFNLERLKLIIAKAAEKHDLKRKTAILTATAPGSGRILPSLPGHNSKKLPLALKIKVDSMAGDIIHAGPNAGRARVALERSLIIQTLSEVGWNQSAAAEMLDMPRNSLIKKMLHLNIPSSKQPSLTRPKKPR